jgi:hypothetical protein
MLPADEHEADTGGAEQGERVDDRETSYTRKSASVFRV